MKKKESQINKILRRPNNLLLIVGYTEIELGTVVWDETIEIRTNINETTLIEI